ncbi:unnamed protein product [Polarella glacialis]|uniref:Secreted protein n=1 Tax=Polarella glacialis TaxID=89957 RepID=A0A813GHA6_POLGL|nr:unnamed protein product [Polarella glacialis]
MVCFALCLLLLPPLLAVAKFLKVLTNNCALLTGCLAEPTAHRKQVSGAYSGMVIVVVLNGIAKQTNSSRWRRHVYHDKLPAQVSLPSLSHSSHPVLCVLFAFCFCVLFVFLCASLCVCCCCRRCLLSLSF